jgi:hypothetical protein
MGESPNFMLDFVLMGLAQNLHTQKPQLDQSRFRGLLFIFG